LAKIVNQYVPLPNAANNAYNFNPLESKRLNQYLGRIDEKLTDKDSIWFYGLYQQNKVDDDLAFVGSNLPGFASVNPAHYYEYTAAWNHTFSATTLNEARFAYLRFNYNAVYPATTQDPASYGFTGITASQAPQFQQLPIMAIAGRFSLGFSADGPQPRIQNTYQVVDNFSKVVGHHTMKFGFNMDRLQINNPFYSNLNGTYQFFGAGLFSSGDPAADFLLGIPDDYAQGSGSIVRARGQEYYAYGQDQWQVKPSLTLTLGLAWDAETPFENLYANDESLDAFHPGQQSTVFPTAPVGLVFPGDAGVNKYGGATVKYDHFAPRLGFAWSPRANHDLSIRGGIGLYYNRTEEETALQTLTNVPFSQTTPGAALFGSVPSFENPYNSVNPTAVGTIPCVSTAASCTTPQTVPFPFTPPTSGSQIASFAPFEPIGFNDVFYDPKLTVPRSTNFNLNVQYQLSKSTVMTLGYVGSVSRHQEGAYNMNPAGTPAGNPVAVAEGATSDFNLAAVAANTFQFDPNVYGEIGVIATKWSSNYNSLQASVNRHFANGLQFQAAYTWSRNFDYTSNLENSAFNNPGFNALSFGRNYGPSANDAPQRLVLNYLYTLPIYRFAHRWRALTDGWNISGISTFQHGFPVAAFETNFTDLQYSGNQSFFAAPDFVNRTSAPLDINHNPRGTLQWVNPAAFAPPPLGVQGTANRNPFYGPGLNYWDMAVEKDIHFTETMYFELRLDTFDTFNHANFNTPVNNVSAGPAFGTIDTVQGISTLGAGRVLQLAGKFYF
jgi:TonB dependent receptor